MTDGGDDLAVGADGLHLLVISPEVFASELLPTSGTITIGRSSRCTVQIEDPMVSREHLRLHVVATDSVPSLAVEDVESANGTRLRDAEIEKGRLIPLALGEAVSVGTTVLLVLDNRGPRRIRSHAFFESRVADECARAAKGNEAFALARLHFDGEAPWSKVLPLLARGLRTPHVFAAYGPRDYEILLVDLNEREVEARVRSLAEAARADHMDVTCGVAWYPKNGRTGDALLAAANSLLKVGREGPPERREVASVELAPMQRVRDMAAKVASSQINVLIVGECGVGKDVLAQLIHKLSPRADKPFLALNCAGLAPTLMESELFGHEKGSFTGAVTTKVGLLESANGGTVFLDEIGDMPLATQVSLLRVIETRQVRPLGALKFRPLDVRFISATNKDIEAAIVKGEFREDLKFRLDVMTLRVPPLRERTEEIPTLAKTFVATACLDAGRHAPLPISLEVMDLLVRYRWPGNIRELKNVMERAVALCDGAELTLEHLPMEKMGSSPDPFVTQEVLPPPPRRSAAVTMSLPPLMAPEKLAERQKIIDALVASNWNQTKAAQRLGMPRRTFVSKLDQFEIPRPQKVVASQGDGQRDAKGDLVD